MRTSPYLSFSKYFMLFFLALSLTGPLPWAAAVEKKININSASVGQLTAVQGIGQDTAENIVAYIKEHGPFKTIEEVQEVNGIGKARLETLKETFTAKPTGKNQKD